MTHLSGPDIQPDTKPVRLGRPTRTARMLVGELGAAAAIDRVGRELRAARRARSRSRFQFWVEVREEIGDREET